MRSLAVITCALAAGCSLDAEGIGTFGESFDGGPDTTLVVEQDTGTIFEQEDALVGDTEAPDTFVDDTTAPDTEMPDTEPVDTGTPDTGPLDMGPPDMGPTASVTVSSSSIGLGPTTINLTTRGPLDWAHWGHEETGSFNKKAGATAITNGTMSGASTFNSGVYRFTWTGGTPTAAATETTRGLTMSSAGEYVSFTVDGDPTKELTLDVYASGTSNGSLTGTLTTSTVMPATINLTSGVFIVTFKFRTATTASKLQVEVKKGSAFGAFNVLGAALR